MHNCSTKNSQFYYAYFTKCKKQIKNLQKSVDKRRSVWYYSQARWGNGQESPEEQRERILKTI